MFPCFVTVVTSCLAFQVLSARCLYVGCMLIGLMLTVGVLSQELLEFQNCSALVLLNDGTNINQFHNR